MVADLCKRKDIEIEMRQNELKIKKNTLLNYFEYGELHVWREQSQNRETCELFKPSEDKYVTLMLGVIP